MADGLLTMFGKAYNTVGSADKNLILLTRGDLKIRWGNKFIDLIKNGKINVDVDILNKIDDKDSIIKDGIYLIENGEDSEVWISIGGKLINLVGEIGKTYVSFVEALDVDADGRFMALSNAGFYYETLETAKANNLTKGLVYIVDENQLYYIKDGQYVKYEPSFNIPNPLVVGNITIDGNTQSIQSKSELQVTVGTNNYISLINDAINLRYDVIIHKYLQSLDYVGLLKGYIIMSDINGDSYAEFDVVKIRKKLEYLNREYYTYSQLKEKKEKQDLIKDREYVITNFQNEWEITPVALTYLETTPDNLKNVCPIVIIADSNKSFKKEGFFEDRPDWIIEYDFDYNYICNYDAVLANSEVVPLYTKGRITKLTDLNNNTANYDFKHRKFKHIANTDDKNDWYYTFSIANVNYGTETPKVDTTLRFLDATEIEEVKVKNNTIYIKEPDVITITTLDENLEEHETKYITIYDEYILFPDCSTVYPYNNKIMESSGRYIIYSEYHDNVIGGLIQNVIDRTLKDIRYSFFNNTFGKIYIKGEYIEPVNDVITLPLTSTKEVKFTDSKEYSNNDGLDITNVEFKGDIKDNIFQNIENVIFESDIESNTFEDDLFEVHFYCTKLKNNNFLGKIDTDSEVSSNRETYLIKGLLENNTFKDIIKVEIDGIIKDNRFGNLKPTATGTLTNLKANINDCIIKDLIGVQFNNNPTILYVIGYDELYRIEYDMENVAIYDDINRITFKGKILNLDIRGELTNVNFEKEVGVSEFRGTLNTITLTTFHQKVLKLDASDSNILNCEFKGEVTYATIRGTITNCSFMKLRDNIEIGLANDTVSDATIQVEIYPSISQWVLSLSDPNTLISCSPLKINTTAVPRLAINAHKECFILSVNPGAKATFIIQLAAADSVPSGTIVMYYPGTLAEGETLDNKIPSGYAICDGTNGTPDLRGKFIRMVDIDDSGVERLIEAVGDKPNSSLVLSVLNGRYDAIQISYNNLPSHTHTFNQVLVNTKTGKTDIFVGRTTNTIDIYSYNNGQLPYSIYNSIGYEEHDHDISFSFTPTQLNDNFDNTPIKIEPNAYALVFIMKL